MLNFDTTKIVLKRFTFTVQRLLYCLYISIFSITIWVIFQFSLLFSLDLGKLVPTLPPPGILTKLRHSLGYRFSDLLRMWSSKNVVANQELDDLYSFLNRNSRQNIFAGHALQNECNPIKKIVNYLKNNHIEGPKSWLKKKHPSKNRMQDTLTWSPTLY